MTHLCTACTFALLAQHPDELAAVTTAQWISSIIVVGVPCAIAWLAAGWYIKR